MHRFTRATVALATLGTGLLAGACSDPLSVDNRNNPNREEVLALPRDVEGLASRLYQTIHAGHFNGNDNMDNQLRVLAFENASPLNNFGMGPRSQIGQNGRNGIDNSLGNTFQVGNRRDYNALVTAAGTAATLLERLYAPGFSLGSAALDARAKAFVWFGYGVALGDLALAYDSTAIPRIGVTNIDSLPLVGYDSAMKVALLALDSAQAIGPTAEGIPQEWLRSTAVVSGPNFVRFVRSYKARFRANVARTPAERAAVAWPLVIADATNGLAADQVVQLNPAAGWDFAWLIQHFFSASWHQQTPMIIGMADSSGAYDAWLATPRETRTPFLIRTRDARFPAGDTRAAQNAATPGGGVATNPGVYFRNRPAGDDNSGEGWFNSQYDHNRWRALFNAVRIGNWVTFTKVENDMLAAEGYIRTGNIPAAVALINVSRVRNNLPEIPSSIALGAPVPGGVSCVPRVPDAAQGFTRTKCGDVFEAMKWEKRMETAFTAWGPWYFDARGWGDMPIGTPVQWPVPYQELLARVKPVYSLGGTGNPGGQAVQSTYGFGTSGTL